MPLFSAKKKDKELRQEKDVRQQKNGLGDAAQAAQPNAAQSPGKDVSPVDSQPKLVFHCQLAHGSPTGAVTGFTSVKELYQKIAEVHKIDPEEILFCTLNTHKVDMERLLGSQIGLDDFIFAHVKGRPKEVEITKSDEALGLTITDNGTGYAFIKRIKEGSIIGKIEGIYVGDHIERVNTDVMAGKRHYEVAKYLKELPRGASFLLRLVEPEKSGFSSISSASRASTASGAGRKPGYGSGKETLRLRSKGPATMEVPDDIASLAIEKINGRLEGFLGINDADLAQTIWDIGSTMKNPVDFSEALQHTDLAMFGFSSEFLFELWGDIGDAKTGRLAKAQTFDEHF